MQYNTNLSAVPPVRSAFPRPCTSLPQRPKPQQPLRSTFHTDVCPDLLVDYKSSTPKLPAVTPEYTTKDKRSSAKLAEPAKYIFDDGLRDSPGTVAYYRSWTFRKKVNAGTAQIPKDDAKHGNGIDDSSDEDYDRKPIKINRAKSLVMIFSRTNVRRAKTQRKVNRRMQQANRRMKFLRELEAAKRFFDWD